MQWHECKKTAVVTGSAGIGLGVALRLLSDGFGVVLCGIDDTDNKNAVALTTGAAIVVKKLDVSSEVGVESLATDLSKEIDGLDAKYSEHKRYFLLSPALTDELQGSV